jgi:O-antigen/teichoic acid export membrane protein
MTGTTMAQAIPIAISPILSRIYSPEDFGVFALYISLVSIIAVIATGRYEFAIMLPKKDEDAINIVALSIVISFLISFLLMIIISTFNTQITNLFSNPKISYWLYFIPLSVFLMGVYQSLNYWFNRKKQYQRLSINKILQSGVIGTTNLGLGFSTFSNSGLIIGSLVGQCIATIRFSKLFLYESKNEIKKIKKLKIFALARKFIHYPKKSAVGAFFNALSYQVEIILFFLFYSSTFLGLFYFVNKFITIPKQLIVPSIWQVFLKNINNKNEVIFHQMYSSQKKLIEYFTFPFILSLIWLPDFFLFAFGENWAEATKFLYPLVATIHISIIVGSFSLFLILNRPDIDLKFNFFLAVSKIIGMLFIHYIYHDIFITVIFLSVIQFSVFLILGSWQYIALGQGKTFFIKLYSSHFISSVLLLGILLKITGNFSLIHKMILYTCIISVFILFLKIKRKKHVF